MADKRVLLVEGLDDRHVIRHLRDRLEIERNFKILDKGGFPRLRDALSVEAKVSGREVLGILVDANEDVVARWNRHQSAGSRNPGPRFTGTRRRRGREPTRSSRRHLVDARQS